MRAQGQKQIVVMVRTPVAVASSMATKNVVMADSASDTRLLVLQLPACPHMEEILHQHPCPHPTL